MPAILAGVIVHANERPAPAEWRIDAEPGHRHVHGSVSLSGNGDSIVIQERMGMSTEADELSAHMRVTLEYDFPPESLRLTIKRYSQGKIVTTKSGTSFPKDANLVVKKCRNNPQLSEQYQVLWGAEVVLRNKVIKSIGYVARLSALDAAVPDFDHDEREWQRCEMRSSPSSLDD
jgi:hypothetical protein